ncbi:hypothetical protein NNA36_12250 [Shimia sp. CNT1-13L.2]|uniref:hypothetical protein n=1 Tax=Shimia sp. CNT1-13L.2 TaxID=2959663 RepID=UPI0020CBB1E1|nr:hypothetical protein [Shimia sp. CNT1-13L.2]MCP9482733.1 hypothetical protein [Shimia sp. CNT1-13L.2]
MLTFLTDLFKPQAPKAPPITSETSMNFDAPEVAPFLTRLANNPRFGLPADLAEQIASDLSGMELGQTRRWKVEGDFDGAPVMIEIEAFMDDIDAPDLTFFGPDATVAEIDRELIAFDEATAG